MLKLFYLADSAVEKSQLNCLWSCWLCFAFRAFVVKCEIMFDEPVFTPREKPASLCNDTF